MPQIPVRRVLAALWLTLFAGTSGAFAQTTNFGPAGLEDAEPRAPGWTITPSLAAATSWDSNVLVRERGDRPIGDYTGAINPMVGLGYVGKHTQVDGSYDGTFLLHRQFDALDSYDQRSAVFARHRVSERIGISAQNTAAWSPTTELVALVGVPFVRTGSTIENASGGVTVALSEHQSLSAGYNLQWVIFDAPAAFAEFLRGGRSHGPTIAWRRALSRTLTLTADYDLQQATITQHADAEVGSNDSFSVQHGWGGFEARLSPSVGVFAAAGIARVGVSTFGPPKTGPAWRGGVGYTSRRNGIDVSYSRSFVPSYSFGGTLENEEINARVRRSFSRRVSGAASWSWRSNESLLAGEPRLHSQWLEGTLAYAAQPWLRLEAFYMRSRQTIDRPGGTLDRTRIGFQIVTSNALRIR